MTTLHKRRLLKLATPKQQAWQQGYDTAATGGTVTDNKWTGVEHQQWGIGFSCGVFDSGKGFPLQSFVARKEKAKCS